MIRTGTRVTVNANHPFTEYHGHRGRVTSVDLGTNIITVTLSDGEEVAAYVTQLTVRKSFVRLFGQSLAVYVTGAVCLLLAMYGANQAQADKSWHAPTGEIGSAVPVQGPTEWQEDSLPDALYAWLGQDGTSAELQHWGEYDGHQGCWAAVADTTLIMCPDGYTETS